MNNKKRERDPERENPWIQGADTINYLCSAK